MMQAGVLTVHNGTIGHVVCVADNVLDDSSGNELMVTFKGFDFLDNELEESEVNWDPKWGLSLSLL